MKLPNLQAEQASNTMKLPNLQAEQARFGLTNAQTAKILGLSRVSYERKKRTGRFLASECAKLCTYFNKSFNYLFYTPTTEIKKEPQPPDKQDKQDERKGA